ncbi:DNA cytosine methyltransferase [Campylobacter troglodytis]|uniref:DNA cytosine methyltransferase n=1 Tax=Campylobacter troglodytis TaxID=654363 RepID=UPI00115B0E4E|nr:DNA (cytosine-5-)-methyltransferase [Campylobacter troglodytis]TQR54098.1 DNA (cytosine-5-)-methyltransferase [Campylobacter troglodytis]
MQKVKLATAFSGIGAIEHAFKRLNIPHEIIFACDINKFVKESYLANYKIKQNQWFDDINDIPAKNFSGKVDFLMGGSPCQSFSSVGKREGLKDDRGNLVFSFIDLIDEIQPSVFMFENVKGLLIHNKGETFKYILKEFESTGYKIFYQVLNAKDYGIPQNRERLYLVGFKDFNFAFEFPQKMELKYKVKDFLQDKADMKYYLGKKGVEFVTGRANHKYKCQINGDIALCQKSNQQFNWHGDFVQEEGEAVNEKYFLSEAVKSYVLKSGTKGFYSKPETDLDIARPLLSTMGSMHRAGVDNYFTYGDRIRKLTPRECLRLMGFDDDFKIVVSDTQMYKQAGNSIVVNVLMAILQNIYKEIDGN